MELISFLFDVFINLDKYLEILLKDYGAWIYLLLFIVIFFETGVIVTPFLPGDSLIFLLGTLAATGKLDITIIIPLLIIAAILGDQINYTVGRFIGPRVFNSDESTFLKRRYLEKTRQFFQKYGGQTVVIARFIPIIRTYAPFTAGCGAMTYRLFIFYNVFGAVLWVVSLSCAGYFLGTFPIVRDNLTIVIFVIIFLSISPIIYHATKNLINRKKLGKV